jgi:hypothetical protein
MVGYVIAAMRCFNGPAKHLGLSFLMLMSGLVILGFSARAIFTGLFFMVGMAREKKMRQYRHARSFRPYPLVTKCSLTFTEHPARRGRCSIKTRWWCTMVRFYFHLEIGDHLRQRRC